MEQKQTTATQLIKQNQDSILAQIIRELTYQDVSQMNGLEIFDIYWIFEGNDNSRYKEGIYCKLSKKLQQQIESYRFKMKTMKIKSSSSEWMTTLEQSEGELL